MLRMVDPLQSSIFLRKYTLCKAEEAAWIQPIIHMLMSFCVFWIFVSTVSAYAGKSRSGRWSSGQIHRSMPSRDRHETIHQMCICSWACENVAQKDLWKYNLVVSYLSVSPISGHTVVYFMAHCEIKTASCNSRFRYLLLQTTNGVYLESSPTMKKAIELLTIHNEKDYSIK